MYRIPLCVLVGLAWAALAIPGVAAAQRGDDPPAAKSSERLVYADFEAVDSGRALSSRGGSITVTSYQESDLHRTTTKGAPGATNTPELVRIKPEDPNHLGKIEFGFLAPNSWAGASLEIRGQADADGKPQADDVTGFKKITLQLYATGAEMIRIEAVSRGHGMDMQGGWPKLDFRVRPGLNTYEVVLKSLAPPSWVDPKPDTRKLLAKLTALNITAFCEPCRPTQGILIVDNVAFEK